VHVSRCAAPPLLQRGSAASLGITQSPQVRRWDRRGRSLTRGALRASTEIPASRAPGAGSECDGLCHSCSEPGQPRWRSALPRVDPPAHLQQRPTPGAGTNTSRPLPPSPLIRRFSASSADRCWPCAGPTPLAERGLRRPRVLGGGSQYPSLSHLSLPSQPCAPDPTSSLAAPSLQAVACVCDRPVKRCARGCVPVPALVSLRAARQTALAYLQHLKSRRRACASSS
jgi:hypothetical protein